MNGGESVLDALVSALERAGAYSLNDQSRPAAVLWPDRERQWEALVPRLRPRLPVLTLGPYAPEEGRGPAFWLRCVLAGTLGEGSLNGSTPVIYLPGVSRHEIRAVDECPSALQPIAELQYRGAFWTQRNGRDWSIAAFLQSADGGLGIDVAADAATRESLKRALTRLAGEPVARLRTQAPVRAELLDALLAPDQSRMLLLWLGDPVAAKAEHDSAAWDSFLAACRRTFGFDPERDGPVGAAQRLAGRAGPWQAVWQRFAEAPAAFPGIPDLLARARPAGTIDMFSRSEVWPQDNEAAESALRGALLSLESAFSEAARTGVLTLEKEHGERRDWVWATLGRAPLARALAHLACLARATERVPGGGSVMDAASAYAAWGWEADAAMIDALAAVESPADLTAVRGAAMALYRPWLEQGAVAFQAAAESAPPEGGYSASPPAAHPVHTCLIFSDGLRFDVAKRLGKILEAMGLRCEMDWRLTALPSVTSTAKPAVSPVADHFRGGEGFDVVVAATGTRVSADVLRKELEQFGYQPLRPEETGDPTGRAWTELGNIDSLGHRPGVSLPHVLDGEVRALARRIEALLDAGWSRVVVVTDHGWLFLPGGLPKAELPSHLARLREDRCARLTDDAVVADQTVPWYWDASVRVALPAGIHSYMAGRDYAHGGLSPQECVTPILTVARGTTPGPVVAITQVMWRGLRCSVHVEGVTAGTHIDLRTKAADASSSLTTGAKALDGDGSAALFVPDEDRTGEAALVVVLGGDGMVLVQTATVVGG